METKSGYVSISTENIFPIIKKWLYSEKDIFIREIVSNACDAISKMKKLVSIGEADLPDEEMNWKIEVLLDKKKKTITVYDNGIGMTEEEVLKYINQIAFSGVKDFVEKYEGKTDESQIIGHFGLGFYSSFMVSKKVEIDTLSWVEGAEPIHWESNTGMDYSISPSKKIDRRGTYVTMHIADDSKEFLDKYKLRETLRKYFSFLPVDLYFIDVNEKKDKKEETEEDKPKPINDPNPLWLKNPNDCTDEEYKEFYKKVFMDFNDPLFWIHLNMDYPYNLKGILYFPKLKLPYDSLEGTIKIFYNQVFVADNIKELIPEFLMLLKGVIDCPDLPLNVSRSF
nr:molecular chaperone HtpG [Clostridia bacterium]